MLTKNDLIIKRSDALKMARQFFYDHNYYETDCPLLSPFGALDYGIDLFSTKSSPSLFLHSSPEYGMKKCLAKGSPSIFQISHVFRQNEKGSRHKQEFMMAEFYKKEIAYLDFIEETLEFIELFTKKRKRIYLSYQEAFLTTLHLDPFKDLDKIRSKLKNELSLDTSDLSEDDILSCAMGFFVEKAFPKQALVIVKNFPKSQAALADSFIDENQLPLAFRFEIFCEHLELANGYKELQNATELKLRFDHQNFNRTQLQKDPYPIDLELIECLDNLPDCCGVACGFDRLMMIYLNQKNIDSVHPIEFV